MAAPSGKMNLATRQKLLISNYVEASISGEQIGYYIRPVEPDNYEHYYILVQPRNGIYKGQSYVMEMKTTYGVGEDVASYPMDAPYIHFITNIFHVNISPNGGAICLDILKDKTKWVPTNSFSSIIMSIMLLFEDPNNASPFNHDASVVWARCEKEYKERKHKSMSIEETDRLRESCFNEFSKEAIRVMQKNTYRPFIKHFPQLAPDDPDYKVNMTLALEEFEAAKAFVAKKPKPAAAEDKPVIAGEKTQADKTQADKNPSDKTPSEQPVADKKKPNRWAKYQKQ